MFTVLYTNNNQYVNIANFDKWEVVHGMTRTPKHIIINFHTHTRTHTYFRIIIKA
jgi:hypothetical protein